MKTGKSIEQLLIEFSELEPYGFSSLLLHCRACQVPFDLEQSVRIDRIGLFHQRLLVSLDASDYHRAFEEEKLSPFARMNVPSDKLQQLHTFLPKAWRIHFGWELGNHGWVAKSYLELRPRFLKNQELEPSERLAPNQLLFLGYKWPLNGMLPGVVTKYNILCHSPPREAITQWESSVLHLNQEYESSEFKSLTTLLKNCDTTEDPLLVLEVSDEGSARFSYDINLYDLEQTVDTVRDPFSSLIYRLFRESVYQYSKSYLESIAKERLGHLATGVDRHGSIFWTLYYGAIRVITQND